MTTDYRTLLCQSTAGTVRPHHWHPWAPGTQHLSPLALAAGHSCDLRHASTLFMPPCRVKSSVLCHQNSGRRGDLWTAV